MAKNADADTLPLVWLLELRKNISLTKSHLDILIWGFGEFCDFVTI